MKKRSPFLFCAALLAACHLPAPTVLAADLPAYRSLVPLLTAECDNLTDAVRHLRDGLAGAGNELSITDSKQRVADFLYLPNLDEIDPLKPLHYFLLSNDPPTGLPDPAVILPVVPEGAKGLIQSLRSRYDHVEGGSIKICSGPRDGKAVEPLYVAIAEGNALVSQNVDAIRWMAYNLQNRTVPQASDFREAPVRISVDGRLAGLLLELIASLGTEAVSEEATADNLPLHVRELGVFAASFRQIDMAVDASLTQWDVSLQLKPPPGEALAETLHALKPPADAWFDFIPPFASNRTVSDFPAFVSALPASNRRWLASFAENTRLFGFGIVPYAFDFDEMLRPHLTGAGLSAFVADKATDRFGSITIAGLKSVSAAKAALRAYFSSNGAASKNPLIRNADFRSEGRVIAYDITPNAPAAAGTSLSHAGAAVSQLLDLNHVEIAVKADRLIVARGVPGFIDLWLGDRPVTPWSGTLASLTGAIDDHPGETTLGGGAYEPVALVRRIIQGAQSLAPLLPRMPHPGNGFAWRMARADGGIVFDLRLYGNELLACNLLRGSESTAMKEFLSELVMRHFQHSTDAETRQRQLREKLEKLRDK